MTFSKKKLSVIIPVYNEEENIVPLVKKLAQSLHKLSLKDFEVIFVDDGSTDKTMENILAEKKKNNFIRLIKLRRNFGKSSAYSVGFQNAKFDIILTMDGDLQDDPAEIGYFLEKIDEGYDLVTGWKVKGKGTIEKTLLSRLFNKVVSVTFGLRLHDFNCPFKAYRKNVVKGLKIYSGLYRFIPIFAYTYGFKITETRITNHPRIHGKSKYGGARILSGFFDYLTALFLIKFNQRPMYFFGSLAIGTAIGGTIILVYMTVLSFQGQGVGSRPLFILGVLLEIMSVQFFSIGFIAEMFTKSLVDVGKNYLIENDID